MRSSDIRPRRSVRTPTDTLSTESRFTALGRGTGSSEGSSRTSLASPRRVVVQGATTTRRRRGMAASRDRTTTGRRLVVGRSHHQTSPRAGSWLTMHQPLPGRRPSRPTHRARSADVRRRPRKTRRSKPSGAWPAVRLAPRPSELRRSNPHPTAERPPEGQRQQLCSNVCDSCHDYATTSPAHHRRLKLAARREGRDVGG